MLKKLYVRNYALIKELELDFDKGLTIITGETGAGKSILLGALGLILGNRADSNVLLDKSDKCVVEGVFTLGTDLSGFFENNDLDYSNPCVVRREILSSGRSRAFINDTPVTLDLMKELGSAQIDIHSQHQTLMLGNSKFQLSVIDSFAGHNDLIHAYKVTYREFRFIEKEYLSLKSRVDQNQSDFEYYNHQLVQLDEANLQKGEETELEKERDLLLNASEVHEALISVGGALSSEDYSIVPRLTELKKILEKVSDYLPEASAFLDRLDSSRIELNDLSNEIERRSGGIESDPKRLDFLNSRLDTLFALMQRHSAETVSVLIEKREELRSLVDEITVNDIKLEELGKKMNDLRNELLSLAKLLSSNRLGIIPDVEAKMKNMLIALGMPNGRFEISLKSLEDFGPSGIDNADFLFSANKQIPPENLARVGSGGELSRVMLSLKSMLTDNNSLPTIFFDEIDSGVSGEVATKVGEILASMGKNMQVINITHLPQVAAHGHMHYFVFKEEESDSTITHIKLLDKKERLNEVARLLSGNQITEASIENARELINGV